MVGRYDESSSGSHLTATIRSDMKRPNDLLSSLWQATVERTDFYSKLILSVKEVVVMCKKIVGLGAVCLIITLLCCACTDADKKRAKTVL